MRNLDFLVKVFFLMKFYIIFILTKISSCVIENFIVIIFYCNRKYFVNKAYPNRKKMHSCRTMHNSLLKTTKIFNFKKYVCKYAKLVCTIDFEQKNGMKILISYKLNIHRFHILDNHPVPPLMSLKIWYFLFLTIR